jgi:hypothetical protein
MGEHVHEGDFYEEDEPIEDILAAWERSTEHVVTERPAQTFSGGTTIELKPPE